MLSRELSPQTIIEIDLAMLEVWMVGDAGDGGVVEFSVKELLQDISRKIEDQGNATRGEMTSNKSELRSEISALKLETHNALDTLSLAIERRVAALEVKAQGNDVRWAKVAGVGVVFGIAAGTLGSLGVHLLAGG